MVTMLVLGGRGASLPTVAILRVGIYVSWAPYEAPDWQRDLLQTPTGIKLWLREYRHLTPISSTSRHMFKCQWWLHGGMVCNTATHVHFQHRGFVALFLKPRCVLCIYCSQTLAGFGSQSDHTSAWKRKHVFLLFPHPTWGRTSKPFDLLAFTILSGRGLTN